MYSNIKDRFVLQLYIYYNKQKNRQTNKKETTNSKRTKWPQNLTKHLNNIDDPSSQERSRVDQNKP